MIYTLREHLKFTLIGVSSGMLSGLFFALYLEWNKNPTWLSWGVPLFVVLVYFIIFTLLTYPICRAWSK